MPKKLGVHAGHRVLLDGAPAGFELRELPADVSLHRRAVPGLYDVIVLFCPDQSRLRRRWRVLHRLTPPAGALWVAWPKRASGLATDLDENVVREYVLANGRVDVKVCAIDETWSALKNVIRVGDRPSA
ncbi:DUF3052 domain-containing protein [Dactylosporangium sp. CA-233914]|uniref:DUF3052 domain-containing protein n=1 Tax=Dactylosporangium sp. CA-233914 TaxID=3239934 RepID=UPI003D8E8EA4